MFIAWQVAGMRRTKCKKILRVQCLYILCILRVCGMKHRSMFNLVMIVFQHNIWVNVCINILIIITLYLSQPNPILVTWLFGLIDRSLLVETTYVLTAASSYSLYVSTTAH